ncbi:apolipoprotein N-acyltransferase [Aquabacterium sp. A08]|uniref:apolipoprotein N-acyltransferase n=1 Tax=Aquabacterium sp. A08 TaxID=2718532 RepID=UPI00141E0A4C|nr:apolipoprotein N-acyltransferase [Aquabacterium sp. A08]NIC41181.1 apolipoprotein N-acyltransferase [Aquabacterium sp. A08]
MSLERWAPWALLLAAGWAQAAALAWPGPSWGLLRAGEPVAVLQWASLAWLAGAVLRAPSGRAAAARAGVFATAWLSATFWWLFVSMHTYGGLAAPLAALAVLALAAFLSVYYAGAGALCWRWRRRGPLASALAFAALWTLAEWARGTWFTGFPWGAGGYAQVDALAALAPYVGVYGMGAVSAFLAAWAAGGARQAGPGRGRVPAGRLWAVGLALPLMALPWVGRGWAEAMPVHTVPAGRLPVTLLQGNIPQNEKFEAGSGVPLALAWYGEQLQAAAARRPGGLVVAPETAVPLLPQDLAPGYWDGLQQAAQGAPAALLLGVPLGNWADGYTNSVAGWAGADPTPYRYDKHHLVPFGEFIPWGFRWFTELMHIPLGDFRRGALAQPPLAWAGQRIAPNVCYEDVFGEELAASFRDPAQAPTVLVNVSNLAWFGDTVAIDQHRHMSRLRALELERPMLRATNTGATAVIDHRGRVQAELPRLTRTVLEAEVEGRHGVTPYARWAGSWGLWPLVALCLGVLAGLAVWGRAART